MRKTEAPKNRNIEAYRVVYSLYVSESHLRDRSKYTVRSSTSSPVVTSRIKHCCMFPLACKCMR